MEEYISGLLRKAELAVEAENMMARHCYYHAACWNRQELESFWDNGEGVRWTQGRGRRSSYEKFYEAYGLGCEQNCRENYEWLLKKYPQVEGRDPAPLMEMAVHTLTTPVIEVADDLQSVKAWWYTPGSITSNLNWTEQKEGRWIWERYAVDFMAEDGKLKFQRASVYADFMSLMDDGDPSKPKKPMGPPPEGEQDGPQSHIIPHDDRRCFHSEYSPDTMPQDTPPLPVPYKTMDESYKY